jgi:hypothetical protein
MKPIQLCLFAFAMASYAQEKPVIDLGEATTERKVRRPEIEIIESQSLKDDALKTLFEAKLKQLEHEYTKIELPESPR